MASGEVKILSSAQLNASSWPVGRAVEGGAHAVPLNPAPAPPVFPVCRGVHATASGEVSRVNVNRAAATNWFTACDGYGEPVQVMEISPFGSPELRFVQTDCAKVALRPAPKKNNVRIDFGSRRKSGLWEKGGSHEPPFNHASIKEGLIIEEENGHNLRQMP